MTLYQKTAPLLLSAAAAAAFGGTACKENAQEQEVFFGHGTLTAAYIAQDIAKHTAEVSPNEGIGYGAGFRFINSGQITATANGIMTNSASGDTLPMALLVIDAPEGKTLDTTCTLKGTTVYSAKETVSLLARFNEKNGDTFTLKTYDKTYTSLEHKPFTAGTQCSFKPGK